MNKYVILPWYFLAGRFSLSEQTMATDKTRGMQRVWEIVSMWENTPAIFVEVDWRPHELFLFSLMGEPPRYSSILDRTSSSVWGSWPAAGSRPLCVGLGLGVPRVWTRDDCDARIQGLVWTEGKWTCGCPLCRLSSALILLVARVVFNHSTMVDYLSMYLISPIHFSIFYPCIYLSRYLCNYFSVCTSMRVFLFIDASSCLCQRCVEFI